jgi:hypothetical protein
MDNHVSFLVFSECHMLTLFAYTEMLWITYNQWFILYTELLKFTSSKVLIDKLMFNNNQYDCEIRK